MDNRQQWQKTLKEQDAAIEAKKNARLEAMQKYGNLSKEAEQATKEYREAIDMKQAIRKEMLTVARQNADTQKERYLDMQKRHGPDSREAGEAGEKWRNAREEEKKLEHDLKKDREIGK